MQIIFYENTKYQSFIYDTAMSKTKGNGEKSPDPYEDIVRIEKLDAYEAIIKFNLLDKNNKRFVK